MFRTCAWVAVISLAITGCKKESPPVAQPVVPDSSNGPPEAKKKAGPVEERQVAIDLSPYMIRGEITVPEGCKVRRRMGGGSCFLDGGKGFAIEVEKAAMPLAATKQHWTSLNARFLKDEPNVLLAELRGIAEGTYAFETRIKLGEDEYRLSCPVAAPFTSEQAERMLKSALSLKQTDAIKVSMQREPKVIAALKAAGCMVMDVLGRRELHVRGPVVGDDDLAGVKDIAGLSAISIYPAPKLTAAGMSHLAAVRGLETLVLHDSSITDQLAAPLRGLSGLGHLSIAGGNLTDAGLAFVAGMNDLESLEWRAGKGIAGAPKINGAGLSYLKGHKNLAIISLEGETMDDVGLENLGAIRSLRELKLERVRITDGGLSHLRDLKNLEGLTLNRVPIRGTGLGLASSLPKLKKLNLDGCPISDAGLSQLRSEHVAELSLSQTAITDAGLRSLAGLSSLRSLNLQGTKVTDAGLAHLGAVKGLAELNLAGTNVTGKGFAHLKAKPDLEKLILDDSSVADDALAELAGCPNLAFLHLSETAITDAGLDKLHEVKSLRSVALEGSDVTRAGVDRLKGAVKRINVNWTAPAAVADPKPVSPPVAIDKLPAADPTALAKKYKGQTQVDETGKDKPVISVSLQGSAITDEEIAHLRAWKSLRRLNLNDCKNLTDACLPYVAMLDNLTELYLPGTAIKGDGLVHLKGIVELAKLELPATPMTIKQAAPLAALTELERLRITLPDSDESLRFYANFRKLKEIDLRNVTLSNRRMALIGRIVGLERLDIYSPRVGDRGLAHLKELTKLQELRLLNTSATDDGLKTVGGLTGLKALTLTGPRFTSAGCSNLLTLTELERLKFDGTAITDSALSYLRECTKLIELELRGADITDKGLASLAELKDLELIDLSGTRVTDAGLKHFKALDELRKLIIEDSAVTGTGFTDIRKLKRLSRVILNRSKITDQGLESIAEIEEDLELLELDGTAITDAGLAHLKALPVLKVLSLNGTTKLTDKAVEILKTFPYLTEVALKGSGVSAKAIAELKKKEGLTVHAE
jgi:Leucine-rich repeat (LRR) protein